ncbi:hypothetical protein [Paludisphaera mucosa]|uniref:Uncharacterized protein n=1 Tax=Paludisphaera mucosa TaxID=3030827 RepID=A0ABT6F6S5_9BACT|nr:hypothetical protein [Paludisphaera mucosa]MDG3003292.1 hypothetical protein [Paludisphaera mucosa]
MSDRRVIAEVVRMRRLIAGRVVELDVVIAPAAREAELLEARPALGAWTRAATIWIATPMVLFVEPTTTPAPAHAAERRLPPLDLEWLVQGWSKFDDSPSTAG